MASELTQRQEDEPITMYEISKDFTWSASHQLHGLPDGHPCGRMHGHNYTARLTVSCEELDATGFVVDYGRLRPFQEHIDTHLDHQHLNDAMTSNPTAENLAGTLTAKASELLTGARPDLDLFVSVAVSETPKTWAHTHAARVVKGR